MFETRRELMVRNGDLESRCDDLERSRKYLELRVGEMRRKIIRDAIGTGAHDELLELRGKVKGMAAAIDKSSWQVR